MKTRDRIRTIVAGEPADRCGFWLGSPLLVTWPLLHAYFGTSTEEELRRELCDDFRWFPAGGYRHPEGKPMFDTQREGNRHGAAGRFRDCEDPREVEDVDWPNPEYLDVTEILQRLRGAGDVYRASGFWSPFFHDVAGFFGMENYFIKMFTHPEVVHAVTRHVVGFYLEANDRFFRQAGDLIDAFFFGNDFGTQRDLLISPSAFDEFVMPYMGQLANLGRRHGLQVILHSCGAVKKVIPKLVDLGVDALHPLQARAAGMDAGTLAAAFKGKLAFIGGIDTQDLLVNGTPNQVREDVRRVQRLLGPSLVVSPSHEAVLPNVPPKNLAAMAHEAVGGTSPARRAGLVS